MHFTKPYPSDSTLRRRAFERLGEISVSQNNLSERDSNFSKLCSLYASPTIATTQNTTNGHHASRAASRAPMGIRELEVLLSLCRAASLVSHADHANRLVTQLGPYLTESCTQNFRPSPLLKSFQPSPWELIAHNVTSALLSIGARHQALRSTALSYIKKAVNSWLEIAQRIANPIPRSNEVQEPEDDLDIDGEIVRLCVVIVGTLTALSEQPGALTPSERFTLLQELHDILSEDFMINLEERLVSMRNSSSHYKDLRPWKRVLTTYASTGRPLGALILQQSYMRLIASCTLLFVAPPGSLDENGTLEYLIDAESPFQRFPDGITEGTVDKLAGYVVESIAYLEADASFLRVTSGWQQRLAFSMKAYALKSFLHLSLFEDTADADILMGWLEAVVADQIQLADEELAQTALKCMVIIAMASKSFASSLGRSFPRLVVQGKMTPDTAAVAADCLARLLLLLPQDMLISTLYTLGNILSVGSEPNPAEQNGHFDTHFGSANKSSSPFYSQSSQASSISLVTTDLEDMATAHGTVVQAVVRIATRSKDEKIISLAISLLFQKLGRGSSAIDLKILVGSGSLGLLGSSNDLRMMLKVYSRLAHHYTRTGETNLLAAVTEARLLLARELKKSSPLYEIYLVHLLDTIVSTTGSVQSDKKSVKDGVLGAEEIAQILRPLAVLLSSEPDVKPRYEDPQQVNNLARDAWYNLVAHDFTLNSFLTRNNAAALETIALYSPSLVEKDHADVRESSLELNTVLRRNMNPAHTSEQKQALIQAFPAFEHEIYDLDYAELTFLNAAHLIAVLRAKAGTCTRTMEYFSDNKFKSGELGKILMEIANVEVEVYLQFTKLGQAQKFSAPRLASQLVLILQACCHRIAKVRHVAIQLANRIIDQVPSALCQRISVFAMLELLTLMWNSCLDEETEDIEWQTSYTSKRGGISIQLSDDFEDRRETLSTFLRYCRQWVAGIVESMPLDIKALLQTYLSDFEDEGAYGHVALGRSFAMEMGCLIPKHDLRVGNMDKRLDIGINSASEFVAQYTMRQQYRAIDSMFDQESESFPLRSYASKIMHETLEEEVLDAVRTLREFSNRLSNQGTVTLAELRPALNKAAAVLCRADVHNRELVSLLVRVPCQIWTRDSIKVAVSLWMGVLRENARFESQILLEVLTQHELNLRTGRTSFPATTQNDPFYGKHEFAPSERDAIKKRQQYTSDIISPFVRMYQFITSHFYATRFATPFISRIYLRTIRIAFNTYAGQPDRVPIGREMHFKSVLSGFRVAAAMSKALEDANWMLSDLVLSSTFRWFAQPPRWSFGGNKLQLKADLKIMSEVATTLNSLMPKCAPATSTRRGLRSRVELAAALVQDEIHRLLVWLSPLDGGSSHPLHGHHDKKISESSALALLPIAFVESASLAVQFANRFRTERVIAAVRNLLLKQPEKAVAEPEAVPILLGVASQHPSMDQSHIQQIAKDGASAKVSDKYLRYLLYWASVNPITAVTYFLPVFGNQPFIIQYGIRALEWHSVDVTFFYVPQIVQTLRYDNLGYVERYIIETAKFSQLFAHQIIWNMKANAYKDEDSQIPDSIKPVLDVVMDALIESFSPEDRDFYVREFDFFNEVTGISGKLRPLIKRPKPEKKQKIEEELRKIQVEVGVYLPSNPDGVVIGIDRQSGKPLQSHAKAPFMATFRIRKERKEDEFLSPKASQKAVTGHHHNLSVDTGTGATVHERKEPFYYEVWQSAIFKVGDDCRQDVLALQLISTFRSIFNSIGLDVYVFPYRVTATAPGCGVIDVLPNSISRDMLGREQVNGLYEYFLSHFGTEDSLAFQRARANFVKSMAAYSVISYLLQFKDRHNGNIMIDDQGHILHIDFGFLFDIAPGGVRFERSPFKLTSEMVAVMGGSPQSAPYLRFEELCVKAFLAARPYTDKLASLVTPMLESGLPCFKPETIKHFRERFVLDKTERDAAEFMRMLVRRSESSFSTKGYDQFQLLTNGIPY
ncbi:phosphatidylinositol 3 [Myriangium duriaei CBS 260.36]|uniref:1-phosphatidylinositol 4-kinase n=1 Tax=Myriangium duriaei CBS 260.36 TaxID=1168546 RepID=A0A9P4MJ63_9PEZI|nr:phosphatidylinositol 3 [Myriangium duriaei CBS 260.36]